MIKEDVGIYELLVRDVPDVFKTLGGGVHLPIPLGIYVPSILPLVDATLGNEGKALKEVKDVGDLVVDRHWHCC